MKVIIVILNYNGTENTIECVDSLKKQKTSNINFEIELKQFLPKSHWPILRDFKTSLEREINRFK